MTEVIKASDCTSNIGDYDVPIYNAIIIPQNATNGDVIKLLFPQIESKTTNGLVKVYYLDSSNEADDITIFEEWWNAPYKAESEDKECSE